MLWDCDTISTDATAGSAETGFREFWRATDCYSSVFQSLRGIGDWYDDWNEILVGRGAEASLNDIISGSALARRF